MFSDRAKGHGVEGVTVSFPAKLKLGDGPGISACHQSTEPEKYGSRRDSERILEKQGQRGHAAGFGDEGRDHAPRNVGSLLELKRVKTQILF